MDNMAFAEIIESSLDSFTAQSWQWNNFPEFGSLVKVENQNNTALGIVIEIQTGSMDPMRYPFPYRKTEEELKNDCPQIFEFLKTTFKVQILGYIEKSNIVHYTLPNKPCKIHAFVSTCNKELIEKFFSRPDFLHLLFAFSHKINNLDELLLANIQNLKKQSLITKENLHKLSQTFSLLIGNDYRRLKLFFKRVQSTLLDQ